MTDVATSSLHDQCVEEVFQRIVSDLSMIADRGLRILSVATEHVEARPAGRDQVHISFRLGFRRGDEVAYGCLLVPLPDAISLACYLMMASEEMIAAARQLDTLDPTTKDAMLEVGSFICDATDSSMRAIGLDGIKVTFEGCQGVRADVRPAFDYEEGDSLLVGRAEIALADFEPATMILLVPNDLLA